MATSFTPNGRLHSPFRIFVAGLPASNISDVLRLFRLDDYRPKTANSMDRQIAVAELDHWTLFADDWFYTLWHMPTTNDAVREIAMDHRVYTDHVGDCDESYGFAILSAGQYVRRIHVDSPNYSDQKVAIDVGPALNMEPADRCTDDIEGYVDAVARSIGIRLPSPADRIYAFGPSN